MESKLIWEDATGTRRDITGRCGGVILTDDMDSLSVQLTLEVQQGRIDRFHPPLGLVCGDRIRLYRGGTLAFDGQIVTTEDRVDRQGLTVMDDGFLLSKNDIVLQLDSVAADTAVRQLCTRMGVAVGQVPPMPTRITRIFRAAASSALEDILAAVTAESGRAYLVRVRQGALHVLCCDSTPVNALFQMAGNLAQQPIGAKLGEPSVRRSTEDLRNAVQVRSTGDDSAAVLGSAQNAASAARYGRRVKEERLTQEDEATAGQKAKTVLEALDTVSEEVSVKTFGAENVAAGCALRLDDPALSGLFRVLSVTKYYETPYTMNLTLRRLT